MTKSVLAVHGIGNLQEEEPDAAAITLAEPWQMCLAEGFLAAGLDVAPPAVVVAYYAHLLMGQEIQEDYSKRLDDGAKHIG